MMFSTGEGHNVCLQDTSQYENVEEQSRITSEQDSSMSDSHTSSHPQSLTNYEVKQRKRKQDTPGHIINATDSTNIKRFSEHHLMYSMFSGEQPSVVNSLEYSTSYPNYFQNSEEDMDTDKGRMFDQRITGHTEMSEVVNNGMTSYSRESFGIHSEFPDGETSHIPEVSNIYSKYAQGEISHTSKLSNNQSEMNQAVETSEEHSKSIEANKLRYTDTEIIKYDSMVQDDFISECVAAFSYNKLQAEETLYRCEICNFTSRWSGVVKRHKRIHTGEKPFKCDECDYR